jgi:hypothetical protein
MKGILRTAILSSFVLLFGIAPSALAASFSADMVITKKGKAETGKFYFSGQYYRMDTTEDGKPTVVIVDKGKNIHRLLDVNEKVYYEIPSDDFRVMSNDAFKASEYMVKNYESRKEGMEKINGMECEKQVVLAEKEVIHAAWISKKLNFPIKLVTYYEGKERYVCELKDIKQGNLPKNIFKIPADFKQKEDPAAAIERKREEQRKAEEALPALTKVGREKAPCYVKIAAGGELHISIDTDREAFLEVTNMVVEDSEFTLTRYRNGKPSEVYPPSPWKLDRNGRNTWDFNDDSDRRDERSLVDEVVIKVNKGLVYAYMRQRGEDRKDFYNRGKLQNGAEVDPKRAVTVKITGDNPFGPNTTGKFYLSHESGAKSEVVPFTVENGKTLTWDYPASKGINGLDVMIKEGDGRAKISVIQPPDAEKAAAKKTDGKTVNVFTVTHPSGAGKPLLPGKNLLTTVTGNTDDVSGVIQYYTDRNRTKKVDVFSFKLMTKQTETFFLPGYKKAGWAMISVYKGSFEVKFDQSPGVKPPVKTKKEETPVTKDIKTGTKASQQKKAATVKASKPPVTGKTIYDGKVPLMKDARVVKEVALGPMTQVDVEVSAGTEEVINFYKDSMAGMGWQIGVSTVQEKRGMLQLKKDRSLLTLKVTEKSGKTTVNMVMMKQ